MRINEITSKPVFILVMGGAGSGKSYWARSKQSTYNAFVIDVDEYKKHMPLSAAIANVKKEMTVALESRRMNVMHPTTGAHLVGQQNKLKLAKEHGYYTVVVLVDTPIETCIERVKQRVAGGEHDVDEADIIRTNNKARENFTVLALMADKAITV